MVSDFTMSGKASRFGCRTLRPRGKMAKSGHRDAVVGEQLLGERLVAAEQEAARVAARVRHLQQLEVGHDVVVEGGDVVEALEQVEGDVGLEVEDGVADRPRSSPTPSGLHLVAERPSVCTTSYSVFQRRRGSSPPRRRRRAARGRVHEGQDAQLLARLRVTAAPGGGRVCRWFMVWKVSISVKSSRASSSGRARRRPSWRQRMMMSSSTLVDRVLVLARSSAARGGAAPGGCATGRRRRSGGRASLGGVGEEPQQVVVVGVAVVEAVVLRASRW